MRFIENNLNRNGWPVGQHTVSKTVPRNQVFSYNENEPQEQMDNFKGFLKKPLKVNNIASVDFQTHILM